MVSELFLVPVDKLVMKLLSGSGWVFLPFAFALRLSWSYTRRKEGKDSIGVTFHGVILSSELVSWLR